MAAVVTLVLFCAKGQGDIMASGIMQITIQRYEDILNSINDMRAQSEKAVQRTISDFKSRAPSWISQEVCKEYNIKKKDVNEHKKGVKNQGQIKVRGTKIDNIEIVYQGRVLTPTHFGMKPTSRQNRPYQVTAQITKSSGRKALGSNVFLASSGGAGTTQIPFQRKGAARTPIAAVKTISVPQMISNVRVSANIQKRINEEMKKRLEHNLQRIKSKK